MAKNTKKRRGGRKSTRFRKIKGGYGRGANLVGTPYISGNISTWPGASVYLTGQPTNGMTMSNYYLYNQNPGVGSTVPLPGTAYAPPPQHTWGAFVAANTPYKKGGNGCSKKRVKKRIKKRKRVKKRIKF